jgi:hypothetical protein
VEEILRELKGDAIGGLVWREMKQDTRDSFGDDPQQHGGSALLAEIKDRWQEAGRKPRIILVGHSTGAVYICEFLKAAARELPADIKFDVAFLAPACTFDLLADTLTLAADRIVNFRSFGMTDAAEREDQMLGRVYPRSLLYFVSGLTEPEPDMPLVGMQRFHTGQTPFDMIRFPRIDLCLQRLKQFPDSWVWAPVDNGPGKSSLAVHHGDFDDDPTIQASLVPIIKYGF